MSKIRTLKEVLRHLLHVAGVRRRQAHLDAPDRHERFARIYRERVWTLGRDDVPLSGTGSSITATAALRQSLPELVQRFDVRRFVDIGCGDCTWMSTIDLGCDYLGVDIVPSVVKNNIEAYGGPSRQFMVHDIVADKAPPGDLILCREVLFHLSLVDGLAALRNMAASGATYLLLTSDRATDFNAEMRTGDFRLLNLERRPFYLPEPEERISDQEVSPGRFIGLWRSQTVLDALDGKTRLATRAN